MSGTAGGDAEAYDQDRMDEEPGASTAPYRQTGSGQPPTYAAGRSSLRHGHGWGHDESGPDTLAMESPYGLLPAGTHTISGAGAITGTGAITDDEAAGTAEHEAAVLSAPPAFTRAPTVTTPPALTGCGTRM